VKLPRRNFLRLAAGAAALPAVSRIAQAQAFPSRPITMIVPFAAGGPTDAAGRIIAQGMRGLLGQPIVIENIGAADGTLGVGRLARARPDGYTIDMGALTTHVLPGALYQLQYDLLNDFAPIALTHAAPYLLYARKDMPAADLRGLIAGLKAGRYDVSVGVGSAGYRVVTALFQQETGAHFTVVPYRGLAPAIQDLIAGQIDLSFGTPDQLSFARAGNVKVYGAASDRRVALVPDIPTFAEIGLPAISFSVWSGIFAPKGTPGDIIHKLNTAAVQTLADPAIRSRLAELGFEVFPREEQTPEALGALVKADSTKWWPLIKDFGIKAE
jgi:tripartite-type tricarboxylate transporter receptor subunit TctC